MLYKLVFCGKTFLSYKKLIYITKNVDKGFENVYSYNNIYNSYMINMK